VRGIEELLVRDVDAVAICTPPDSHARLTLTALDARRHVLVEKPPALEVAQAERMAAAVPPGLVAACGLNLRGHRLVRRARALIGAGQIGQPRAVHGTFVAPPSPSGWRSAPDRGGGPLLDRAIHHADLWRFLLASEVVESTVTAVPGGVSVTGRLTGGALGRADALEGAPAQEIRVDGDEGRLGLDLYRAGGLVLERAGVRPVVERARAIAGRPRDGDVIASYREQWRAFAAAVRAGGAPLADLDDGCRALAAVLGRRRAAEPERAVAS
jgi:predicted dehydrogenase